MSMLDPLVEALRAAGERDTATTRLATVTNVGGAGVLVRFDGESSASSKRYRAVVGCTVGQRVVMLRVGAGWVVIGGVSFGGVGGGAHTAQGGFATGAPPNSTSGTIVGASAAGTYMFDVQMSGYVGAAGPYTFSAYVDGVLQKSVQFYFNQVSSHTVGPRMVWTQTLSAGAHYLWGAFNGTSDGSDAISITWRQIA